MSQASSISIIESGATPGDLVLIAPNDPAAMNRYAAECHEAGIPYLYDPSMQLPRLNSPTWRRAAAAPDPRRQRLRIRDDGR